MWTWITEDIASRMVKTTDNNNSYDCTRSGTNTGLHTHCLRDGPKRFAETDQNGAVSLCRAGDSAIEKYFLLLLFIIIIVIIIIIINIYKK